ncbi:pirin family protein [uncultured Sphingomonas sp.]|uniref:pirin family protein n=1 Tax=uncultured Sphingomonas sp. TaxID=158754 RepID=UPI0025CF1F20|nr:pirin family protein [uncultured Sphingomonas sp.]
MAVRNSRVDGVDLVVLPPSRDLGDGFTVRRALPQPQRRMVGPFIFFDQIGPVELRPGTGLDVRPHPHIGLATITYLFDGEILHRDSVGSVQPIRPGEVNWMTAGRGIVHSERSPDAARAIGPNMSGLQLWVALPAAHEETAPTFVHHGASEIPEGRMDGVAVRQIVGAADGLVSPVKTLSDMIYLEATLPPGGRYRVPEDQVERAFYLLSGEVTVDGQPFGPSELVVLKPGAEIVLESARGARLVVVGGEPFPEPRHIYWNFVSSRADRIEQAKQDWRAGLFPAVPEEREFIPLPPDPAPPVRYP